MSSILIRTAVLVLLLAVLGLGTGLLFGPGWGWLLFSLGLIGLIVHHVRHLRLLGQWASRSPAPVRPVGRFPTASRYSTPNTASSGATIPAKRISASTPKPTSGSRSPISCASRNSSRTSRRKNSPSPCI